MKVVISVACALWLTAPAWAQPIGPVPRDPQASPFLQHAADHLEAMAHFAASATACGLWSNAEGERFRNRYLAAALDLPAQRDTTYALELSSSGIDRSAQDLRDEHDLECQVTRERNVMPELRRLASGEQSFWSTPSTDPVDAERRKINSPDVSIAVRDAILATKCKLWGGQMMAQFKRSYFAAADRLLPENGSFVAGLFAHATMSTEKEFSDAPDLSCAIARKRDAVPALELRVHNLRSFWVWP